MSDDTIYRQDAIDALAYFTEKSPTGRTAQEVVKALPSAQPEIIYCGECKYMMPNGRCSAFADPSIRPSASDYCSSAERRQDGKTN